MEDLVYKKMDEIISLTEKRIGTKVFQEIENDKLISLVTIQNLNNLSRNRFEARIAFDKIDGAFFISTLLDLVIPENKKQKLMEFMFERNNYISYGKYSAFPIENGYRVDLSIIFPPILLEQIKAESILEYLGIFTNTLAEDADTFQKIIYS